MLRCGVQLSSRRVSMTGERSCQECHTPLACTLFAVLPSGVLLCLRCHERSGGSEDPSTARHYTQQPQRPAEAWPD